MFCLYRSVSLCRSGSWAWTAWAPPSARWFPVRRSLNWWCTAAAERKRNLKVRQRSNFTHRKSARRSRIRNSQHPQLPPLPDTIIPPPPHLRLPPPPLRTIYNSSKLITIRTIFELISTDWCHFLNIHHWSVFWNFDRIAYLSQFEPFWQIWTIFDHLLAQFGYSGRNWLNMDHLDQYFECLAFSSLFCCFSHHISPFPFPLTTYHFQIL